MKCCASPIISTAVKPPDTARVAQSTIEAIIFSEVLKPLAKGLGPVGEMATESVAQRLFAPVRP